MSFSSLYVISECSLFCTWPNSDCLAGHGCRARCRRLLLHGLIRKALTGHHQLSFSQLKGLAAKAMLV